MAHVGNSIPVGASFGVGSLPHRRAADAVEFSWRSTTIPTIPSLPRRSPAELMIAQALTGIDGVSFGQYGGISVDVARIDLDGPVETDLFHEAFGGFSNFLSSVVEHTSPPYVKWQFVGPVTLGAVLVRVGLDVDLAFRLALKVIRSHMRVLEDTIGRACPQATQMIVLDEPMAHDAFSPDFPISVDEVLDFISGALAVVDEDNWSGLHCCVRTDWNALLSTGAEILSVPVPHPTSAEETADLLASARRISEHLVLGGRIAWGAVRTDGPIASSPERSWRALREVWASLIANGVDADLLRAYSFVTPVCGLGNHTESLAEQVFDHVNVLSTRLAEYGVQ
jgi:hypothetical protein